jgi:hypothetical protein
MEKLITFGLPIILATLFYLIIRRVNFSDSKQQILIKFRIFIGLIGIGIILSQAYLAETLRSSFPLILISIIVFYGVVKLQNKYLNRA